MSSDAYAQAVSADDFAALLRAHTRAIHALAGRVEYPEAERRETGEWASQVLAQARGGEAGHDG